MALSDVSTFANGMGDRSPESIWNDVAAGTAGGGIPVVRCDLMPCGSEGLLTERESHGCQSGHNPDMAEFITRCFLCRRLFSLHIGMKSESLSQRLL